MILPHHLNRIIEILPFGRILLIDLRPPADFERSHIRGAINLRAPLKFIQDASLDMIERAFTDQQGRQKFGEWQSTICMVVYARAVDFSWECPVAEVLDGKFRSWGWPGRCFVLKGHYKEFSVSYGRSIVGSKMTDEARAHTEILLRDGDKMKSSEDDVARRSQYEELLTQIDNEGRVNPSTPNPLANSDHARATSQHELDLEAEFRCRVPDLYRKALDVQGSGSAETPAAAPDAGEAKATSPTMTGRWDGSTASVNRGSRQGSLGVGKDSTNHDFDTKAPLVEYLDKGLSLIRQGKPADTPPNATTSLATANPSSNAKSTSGGLSKLAAEGYPTYFDSGAALAAPPSEDSYVKISRGDVQQASDTGHGHHSLRGKDGTKDTLVSGDETPRRGRGGFLSKVLRRG